MEAKHLPRSQQLEYFLQGSLEESSVMALRQRLKGLCDPSPHGTPNKFADHEIAYVLRGSQGGNGLTLRARCALDNPEAPWQLRYFGQADHLGEKSRNVLTRSCLDVTTTDNLTTFLEELGFGFDSEYVAKGYYFKKGKIRVTISRIHRLPTRGNTSHVEAISGSYLVEMSVITPVQQDSTGDELKSFADQLKPEKEENISKLHSERESIVYLEKVDHRKIQLMGNK